VCHATRVHGPGAAAKLAVGLSLIAYEYRKVSWEPTLKQGSEIDPFSGISLAELDALTAYMVTIWEFSGLFCPLT
jgi:hypothetical protein